MMKRTIIHLRERLTSYKIVLKRFPMYKIKLVLKIENNLK